MKIPSISKLQRCSYLTVYWSCDYLSMLIFNLTHVSKRGPWESQSISSWFTCSYITHPRRIAHRHTFPCNLIATEHVANMEMVDMTYRLLLTAYDDVIKWKHFPRYWPFVWGIHRSPVNSPHKGQWRGAFFDLRWINAWINNLEAGDLRRFRAHYDATVMKQRGVHSS